MLVKSILINSKFNPIKAYKTACIRFQVPYVKHPICSLSYLHRLVTNKNSQFEHNSLHLVIN